MKAICLEKPDCGCCMDYFDFMRIYNVRAYPDSNMQTNYMITGRNPEGLKREISYNKNAFERYFQVIKK